MPGSSGSISWDMAKKREAKLLGKSKKTTKKDKASPSEESAAEEKTGEAGGEGNSETE